MICSLLLYGGCGFDENESGCVVTEAHLCRSVQTEIFSVAWDRDGATLFMDPSGVDMFKRAVRFALVLHVWLASCHVGSCGGFVLGVCIAGRGRNGHHRTAAVARYSGERGGKFRDQFHSVTMLSIGNPLLTSLISFETVLQIHLGPMVAEFPGVVSFLSKLLAEDQISILNMSTYDTDVIYVQVHTGLPWHHCPIRSSIGLPHDIDLGY